jgi:twinkle protein
MSNEHESDSTLLHHGPCEHCGSSDANAFYSDGHSYCFSCGHHDQGKSPDGSDATTSSAPSDIVRGECQPLSKRRLTEETCRKWGYMVGDYRGSKAQIANYRDDQGRVVAQKIRLPDKQFSWTGEPKKARLYGQHLWRDGGKMIVITEGEIDALSVSQLQQNKWPVVSVPNGAQGAKKDLSKQLEWLEKFESVVLMFDNDEPGKKAIEECVSLFSPGKVKVAMLPLKDANEMLVVGRGAEVIDAMWAAKVWRPDEIVAGSDLWEEIIKEDKTVSVQYPWKGLNDMLHGLRKGEITTLAAGSGIGKSTICRELAHHLLVTLKETVGYIALEEAVKRTALGIMSVHLSKPLHLEPEKNQKKLRKAFEETVGCGRYYSYDHFGSLDSENLLARIRYMVTGCGCGWIVLDHLSIVVSGMEGDDERRLIDNLMTKLRSLVEELGFGLLLVSHLKEAEGKSLEEGGQTHLNLLRGSRAIGQLSDIALGFERNQQDPKQKHLTTVRVLKNRFSGDTGVATTLSYEKKTGRLTESECGGPADYFEEEAEDQSTESRKKDF